MHVKTSIFGFRRAIDRIVWGMTIAAMVVGFSFSPANAYGSLETEVVKGQDVITMTPGSRTSVDVAFKNTGTATWKNDGPGYVSLYTHGPKYRSSQFDPGTWLWGDHVARIKEATVAPGEFGTMSVDLHAPLEEGYYEEIFHLASEDTAWFAGEKLTITIQVEEGVPESVENVPVVSDSTGLYAELAVMSANKIKTTAERPILFTAAFTNTGSKTWNSYGLVAPDVSIAAGSSNFSHPSWNGEQIAYISDAPIPPGGVAVISFAFNAPSVNGDHLASFQLTANGVDVPGATVDIPVEVTGGTTGTVTNTKTDTETETVSYIDQPDIRIGVLIVDEETENKVVITSEQSDYKITDVNGNLLGQMERGEQVTAYHDGVKYYFDRGKGLESSSYGLRFVPVTEGAVMKVINFDRRLTRGLSHAYNEFRGVLELRYNEYKERTWLINELGIEYYLRGLSETNDYDHIEFNKAQVTAARTYAYWHVLRGGKRDKEFMDLNSTPSDQLYQGYGREALSPNFTNAVKQTSGELVTYQGDVAITPYYARSNGSTKNWSDVWWGDQPHARAVSVPCDVGSSQWGHGVGMPQSGAKCLAADGKEWDEILEYFYTGVEVEKRWR